ncbi:diaminopimelate epimerase [Bacillaceae bacterium Marseille-Q3522]|nr:diaminopimelate epimerase [Bacillaceae bacterium Marseille-Q3522]
MKMKLIKCHGSGNDFLLIDETKNSYSFSDKERANLARLLCNRQGELGADGILFVLDSETADRKMRVFNADGSEASMCGNGLRCVARYVSEQLGKETAIIETMKANLHVKKANSIYPKVPTYSVEISPVSFQLTDLPLRLPQTTLLAEKIPALSEELTFTALAVPNPHLISLVDTDVLQTNLQQELSEYVNGENDYFPDGVNVSFVKSIEHGSIYVRTFERGVGFTNACGTAMSASSLVTCMQGYNHVGEEIDVYNNGGKVRCVVHEEAGWYDIDLIGNATYVYHTEAEVNENFSAFDCMEKFYFREENEQYKKLSTDVQTYLKELSILNLS